MARYVARPAQLTAPTGKIIDEYFGRVNTGDPRLGIALMHAPPGWVKPTQTADFAEYSVVLRGCLHVECGGRAYDVTAGQAVLVSAGDKVTYSAPGPDGAEYLNVCLPAFSPDLVHATGS